jgi:hypothetical protein
MPRDTGAGALLSFVVFFAAVLVAAMTGNTAIAANARNQRSGFIF